MNRRAAGILLHPTSLSNRFGIGDFGPATERFLDWAARAGQGWWQILPLGPPRRWGSPYDTRSSFAGNPLLISPDALHRSGLLSATELGTAPRFDPERADFQLVTSWKRQLLRTAWKRARRELIEDFRHQNQEWLDDWALFQVLTSKFDSPKWWTWDRAFADRHSRHPKLADLRATEASEIDFHCFVQWAFFSQWKQIRERAAELGIRILGDLPIYVARASADVWSRPDLFLLDDDQIPRCVSGAPPDDYSADGQLWGNPLYDWKRMANEGFRWWIVRLRATLGQCDLARLDHFRGFVAYWSVPGDNPPDAVDGHWVDGPGLELFEATQEELGPDLPLVAEDLGVLTPEVDDLRRRLDIPGTRVLQFGLQDADSIHSPTNLEADAIVYTATHDCDTSRGWFESLERATRSVISSRIHSARQPNSRPIEQRLIDLAYASPCRIAVVPMQDILGLGSEARMNTPGVAAGNWDWRLLPEALHDALADHLRARVESAGRIPSSGWSPVELSV